MVITFVGTQAPRYPYDVYSYLLIIFHFLFMAFYVPLSQMWENLVIFSPFKSYECNLVALPGKWESST